MYDFIAVPLTIFIVAFFLYKFFELLICRKERHMIIERMDPSTLLDYVKISGLRIGSVQPSEAPRPSHAAAWPLRIGAVLTGLGLGVVVGIILVKQVCLNAHLDGILGGVHEMITGCTLFMGGLGLLVAFIIEHKLYDKQQD